MINVNFRDPRPIYEQIKDGLRRLILSGALPDGSKIPSVREMSAELAINPSTIQRAYRELESEGYICSVTGKGSFVCAREDADKARRKELLDKFHELCTELGYMGVTSDDLISILKGGNADD